MCWLISSLIVIENNDFKSVFMVSVWWVCYDVSSIIAQHYDTSHVTRINRYHWISMYIRSIQTCIRTRKICLSCIVLQTWHIIVLENTSGYSEKMWTFYKNVDSFTILTFTMYNIEMWTFYKNVNNWIKTDFFQKRVVLW